MDTAPTCVLAFVRRLLKCFTHWATVRKMCTCQGDNYMDTRQTCPTDTVTCIHTLTLDTVEVHYYVFTMQGEVNELRAQY